MDSSGTVSVNCSNVEKKREALKNLYSVEDRPPFLFSALNAIQLVICQVAAVVWLPLGLCPMLCLLPSDPMRVYVVSTALLTSGVFSSLQSTLGVRLPAVVSVSPVISAAVMSLLQNPDISPPCPGGGDLYAMGPELRTEEWRGRLRLLQGALLVTGAAQAVIGFSGFQAFIGRTLGPVTVAPAVILAGLNGIYGNSGETYQPLLIMVPLLMILFALVLRNITLPLPTFSLHSGLRAKHFQIFQMFPVLWTCVAVFFAFKLLPKPTPYPNKDLLGFQEAIDNTKWFFFPIPYEWGLPIVSVPMVVHLLPSVLLQSVLSLLLMYADAQVCDVGLPPRAAVSRGLTAEGLGLMFGSLWGHGVAVSPVNIGLMSFTGIVSRSSVQLAALMMIFISHFPGLLSPIANIPIQFLFAVQFFLQVGLVITGVSILRFVNFKSTRDISIVGLSLVFGLFIPQWQASGLVVYTGLRYVDSCIAQCLASSAFMAIAIGIVLDVCLPGRSNKHTWRQRKSSDKVIYKLPTWEELLCSALRQLPFFPSD